MASNCRETFKAPCLARLYSYKSKYPVAPRCRLLKLPKVIVSNELTPTSGLSRHHHTHNIYNLMHMDTYIKINRK